jgi:hypothetical protein
MTGNVPNTKSEPLLRSLVVPLFIVPLLVVSGICTVVSQVVVMDICTGTGSVVNNYFLSCRRGFQIVCGEVALTSLPILFIWTFADYLKHTRLIRVAVLVYLFGCRFLIVYLLPHIQVAPLPYGGA